MRVRVYVGEGEEGGSLACRKVPAHCSTRVVRARIAVSVRVRHSVICLWLRSLSVMLMVRVMVGPIILILGVRVQVRRGIGGLLGGSLRPIAAHAWSHGRPRPRYPLPLSAPV